jgi:hypothetical protein
MPGRDKPKLVSSTPVAVWNPVPPGLPKTREPSFWQGIRSMPLRAWIKPILPMAVVMVAAPFLGFALPLLFVGSLALSGMFLAVAAAHHGMAQISKQRMALAEKIGLPHGEPTRMCVVLDGHTIGVDEGVVVFEDRTLRFYGLRTTFRLSPNVVYAPADGFANGPFEAKKGESRMLGDHSRGIAHGFALRDYPGATVWIDSIRDEPAASTFSRSLYRWMTSPPVEKDNSILPPLEPMPGCKPFRVDRKPKLLGFRSK